MIVNKDKNTLFFKFILSNPTIFEVQVISKKNN